MLRLCLKHKKSIVISHDKQFMLIHSYLLILRINTTEVEFLRGMVNRCLYDYSQIKVIGIHFEQLIYASVSENDTL